MFSRGVLLVFCYLIVKLDVVFGVSCGSSRDCSDLQYCSKFGQVCESCTDVCTKSHHNYDENICQRDCQNYLQYQSRAEVQTLRTLVTISLVLNCIIIVCLLIVAAIKFLQWKTKRGVNISWLRNKLKAKEKSKPDRPTTVSVTNTSGKPDLRLDMPALGIQTPSPNGNTPSTATTTLSRRPTEDNTLDYAYDNPAMSNTPSPHAKPHESTL